MEGMGKDKRVKHEKIGRGRIISTSPSPPFYGLPRRLPPEGIPNIPVRRNRNGRFIWIPTEISRIFGIMGSTLSQVGVPKEAAIQARLRDSHNHLKKPDCETREIRTILNETRGFWKTNRTRGNRHCYLTFNMALVATLCTSWVFSFFSYTL